MEINCPHCGFAREVDPAQVPDRPVKVTCPRCKQGFSFAKPAVAAAAPDATPTEEPATAEVVCPACGLAQPAAENCAGCGIVYAKWEARQQARAAAGEPPATGALPEAVLAELHRQAPALTAQMQPKAGFWIRVVAATIDSLLLLAVAAVMIVAIIMLAGISFDLEDPGFHAFLNIMNIFLNVLMAAYQVFFTGYCGQTPGKMAVRIKVIRTDGSDISYGRAFLREIIGKYISMIILMIGYLMVAFDGQKQGLHDKIADTYVIKL